MDALVVSFVACVLPIPVICWMLWRRMQAWERLNLIYPRLQSVKERKELQVNKVALSHVRNAEAHLKAARRGCFRSRLKTVRFQAAQARSNIGLASAFLDPPLELRETPKRFPAITETDVNNFAFDLEHTDWLSELLPPTNETTEG
jgi:hypothetical protein